MIVARVVSYLLSVNCTEVVTKVTKKFFTKYRQFEIPGSKEFFFLTDAGLFIGESFKNCRPANNTLSKAYETTYRG